MDFTTGALTLSMRLWTGIMGTQNQEEYSPAKLRVNRVLFLAMDSPDPRYPFVPDGSSLTVDGAHGLGDLKAKSDLVAALPSDVSLYRFFVEQWNSFIYIAGSDVQLSLGPPDMVTQE
jgi:hypothetical protein